MNNQHIVKKIKTEIRLAFSHSKNLHGVFGFGSFFRDEEFDDVDILVVAAKGVYNALPEMEGARTIAKELSERCNVLIDMTFLTYSECLTKPLREMDDLVPIVVELDWVPPWN